MIDIFKCLGVPPDVGADEILQLLRDSKSESKWDVKYHDAIALLTAIEQRGERRVWEQMHLHCCNCFEHDSPPVCICDYEMDSDKEYPPCRFDTCPLLRAGEGEER